MGFFKELKEMRKDYSAVLNIARKILNNSEDVTNYNKELLDMLRDFNIHQDRLVRKLDPEKLSIKIKYFDALPEFMNVQKISKGDWIDLRASERVELKVGEYYLIPLGVGMILPDGYEAHIVPRSSTPSKFGIMCANSMGIIDNSYSGDNDEWKFPAVAIRDTIIEKGDRICQFRLMRNQPPIEFIEVEKLNDISRGGIGSTGKR